MMDKNQDLKLIMERIRKVLAMAESPHPEEAATAAEMAHKMLKEYNLTLGDLEIGQEEIKEVTYDTYHRIASWKKILLLQIMRTNYCESYSSVFKRPAYTMGERGDSDISFIIVGREANIAIAKMMADYLISTVEKQAKKYGGGNDRMKSYKVGMTNTLCERLKAMIQQDSVESPESTALVLRENAKVEDYMNKMTGGKVEKVSANLTDISAFLDGKKDGYSISLNSQLKNSKKDSKGLIS